MPVAKNHTAIPILNACSEKPHRSVGTSSAVSLFVGIPGAIVLFITGVTPENAPIFTVGYVSLLAVACVIPLSIVAAPFGVKVGKNVSPATLKRIFAVAMFIVSPGAIVLFITGVTPENAPIFTVGYVSLLAVACVIPLSIVAAPFGVKVGKNVSPATLKRIFAVAMFIVSVRMLISGLA